MNVIEEFESRVRSECDEVDREAAFDEMLDECYSFESVGGIFASMSPSRVLKEIDPVAYRCGVSDYEDSLELVEVGDRHYRSDDVQKLREEIIDELQDEADKLEDEEDEDRAVLLAQITQLRDHSV